ncbi:MAG TPA: geranylgeranyl reductase family protein [Firmicutes bacterium]|nr:geranylgeranyl reductase family protein [Bacillota bacterium]
MKVWDVVIVGAGPAGSTAASVTARAGLSVLLIDKARFPRDKPCAGGVSVKSLHEIGLTPPREVIQREITGLILGGPGGGSSGGHSGFLIRHPAGERIAVTVRRREFDAFLVDLATAEGACFRDGVEVSGLEERDDSVSLRLATCGCPGYSRPDYFRPGHSQPVHSQEEGITARFVIGADGAMGRTAALSGLRRRWRRFELGLGIFVEVAPGEASPEAFQLYCLPGIPCSFGWVFPYRDSVNVGLGASALFSDRVIGTFHSFFGHVKTLWHLGEPAGSPTCYILPAGGFARRIATKRVLLAGDAAGLVDPFSGEGIYSAVVSGRMAGEVVAGALRGDLAPGQASREYQRACHARLTRQFRLAMIMSLMSGYKSATGFRLVQHDPGITENLVRLMKEGDHVYRRLLWWHLQCLPVGLLRVAGINRQGTRK